MEWQEIKRPTNLYEWSLQMDHKLVVARYAYD
jgi:hypothetical protein